MCLSDVLLSDLTKNVCPEKGLRQTSTIGGSSLCFLNKPLAALWTGDLQLALPARNAQRIFTAGASKEFMRLAVFNSAKETLNFLLNRPPVTQEPIVLGTAALDVA
jgi:hypothetical protein